MFNSHRLLLTQAVDLMCAAYPGIPREEALQRAFEEIAGQSQAGEEKKPIFHAGAFCVYWGEDPDTGELVALIHVRKDKKYGAVGGFTEGDEQSVENLRRETMEEIRTGYDMPVFKPRLENYAFVMEAKNHHVFPSLQYAAYSYKLSRDEMMLIKDHVRQWDEDNYYREQSIRVSGGETMGLELRPLDQIPHMSPGSFHKRSQHAIFCEVAQRCLDHYEQISPEGDAHVSSMPPVGDFVSRLIQLHSPRERKKA